MGKREHRFVRPLGRGIGLSGTDLRVSYWNWNPKQNPHAGHETFYLIASAENLMQNTANIGYDKSSLFPTIRSSWLIPEEVVRPGKEADSRASSADVLSPSLQGERLRYLAHYEKVFLADSLRQRGLRYEYKIIGKGTPLGRLFKES